MGALDNLIPEQTTFVPFFSAERKAEIVSEKINFFVTSVELAEARGKFKAQWIMDVFLLTPDNEEGRLGFTTPSPKRDMIFDALYEHFQTSSEPYGPLCLYKIPAKDAQSSDYVGIARPKEGRIERENDRYRGRTTLDHQEPF